MASVAAVPLASPLAAPLSDVALSEPMVRMRAKLEQIAKSEIPRIIAVASSADQSSSGSSRRQTVAQKQFEKQGVWRQC
jgi:hypothetical protein